MRAPAAASMLPRLEPPLGCLCGHRDVKHAQAHVCDATLSCVTFAASTLIRQDHWLFPLCGLMLVFIDAPRLSSGLVPPRLTALLLGMTGPAPRNQSETGLRETGEIAVAHWLSAVSIKRSSRASLSPRTGHLPRKDAEPCRWAQRQSF